MTETCPGCRAELEGVDTVTHRYIGASPACWDTYTRLLAGDPPMVASTLGSLLVDAYAAQHPGGDSPQATQSAAVHLVVLEAMLGHGMALGLAVPARVAAVEVGRQGDGYPKLYPVPWSWELTIADVAEAETATERGLVANRYIRSVWEAWRELHGPRIDEWHQAARQLMKH